MSMKMMEQIHKDHDFLVKSDKKLSDLIDSINKLREDINKKFDLTLKLLKERSLKQIEYKEDKYKKENTTIDIPTFIPDIDISDMKSNIKEEDEKLKSINLENSLNVLDNIIK